MSDEHLVVQLINQLLRQNTIEFERVHEKLDRLETLVEDHDRDIAFGKRVLKSMAAAFMAVIPILIWLWP